MSTPAITCTTSMTGACRSCWPTTVSWRKAKSRFNSWKRRWARGHPDPVCRHVMDTIITVLPSITSYVNLRKVVAPLGQADAGSIDAARRMHRLGYKLFDAAMVHLALPPVVVFLRLLPLRRQELAAK